MTRLFILPALAVVAAGCTREQQAGASSAAAAGALPPLVGTWSLQSVELTDSSGRPIESPHAVGTITYTEGGHMATQSMVLPRPAVPSVPEGPGDVSAWSPEQARKAVETYDAYFGTYEVDETRHTVTHHIEGELRPDHVGDSYVRHYEVDGDRLILSPANPSEHWRVIWERE